MSETPRRRWRWWLGGGVVVVIVAWAALCALTLLQADHRLRAGEAAAQTVRGRLTTAALTSGVAQPALNTAAADFTDAHGLLASAWITPLRIVPVLGRQVTSATDLAAAAERVTEAGRTALPEVRQLLASPHATPEGRAVVVGRLSTVVAGLDRRVQGVGLGPSTGLLSTLATKRDTFAVDLFKLQTGLARADGATAALADLLNGDHTYLVFSANNAEMRSGSGMFLAAGTLTTQDGSLTLAHFLPTSELTLPTPEVPVTGDLARLWGDEHPNQEFRNLGLSPEFPANAALAAAMWRARTGTTVDGVMVLDTGALSALLAATGPVSADGVTVDSADVERYLLHDQYVGVPDDEPDQAARHDRQGALAAATFLALSTGHPDLGALASDLDGAANGRHVLVWSASPAMEADWEAAGVSGQLGPADILLGVLNQGGNKLDPFLSVHATMGFAPASGRRTAVTVAVTVTNTTPAGQPPYVAGDAGTPPAPGTYVGAVALDIPGRAGDESTTGSRGLEAEGPDGPSFEMAAPFQLRAGASTTITYHFTLAGRTGVLRVDASARLPATRWQVGPQSFTDAASHLVSF